MSVPGETPRTPSRRLRIAIAHDWLCGFRGGEAVLDRIVQIVASDHECAGLWTMFDDGRGLSASIDSLAKTTSFLNRIPGGPGALRRWLLPLYPTAVGEISRSIAREHARQPIDLLISTSSVAVKGIHVPRSVKHLCYCHAPARYVWSLGEEYDVGGGLKDRLRSAGLSAVSPWFKRWDRRTAANVDVFLANSTHTANEIQRCFGRDSTVVFPPTRTDFYSLDDSVKRENFWLAAGALEPYKRMDLAIDAANEAKHELVVVGGGSAADALRRIAGDTVKFAGRVSDEELRRLYRTASVLLFPQVEDFGIVAAEAQACGLVVAARAGGGALDTVIPGKTGALFGEATKQGVIEAVKNLPMHGERDCRENAIRFSVQEFDRRMREQIARAAGAVELVGSATRSTNPTARPGDRAADR
mgnify:CR=1 FL=1